MLLLFSVRVAERPPVCEKALHCACFREHLSICMSASFPLCFEGGMVDLTVL